MNIIQRSGYSKMKPKHLRPSSSRRGLELVSQAARGCLQKQLSLHSKTHDSSQRDASKQNRKSKKLLQSSKSCTGLKGSNKFVLTLKSDEMMEGPAESYREYCLVNQVFVPIVNKQQESYLENILFSATAPHEFGRRNNTKQTGLRRKSYKERQVNVCPATEEIGIQYTTRFQAQTKQKVEPEQIKIPPPPPSLQEINAQEGGKEEPSSDEEDQNFQIVCPTFVKSSVFLQNTSKSAKYVPEEEGLSDLLLKLQFRHLPDEQSFKRLSANEKQHYRQLLHSVIDKLSLTSPRVTPPQIISPIQAMDIYDNESFEEPGETQLSIQSFQSSPMTFRYEQQSLQILDRERMMLGQFEVNDLTVDTRLPSVVNYLCQMFCYLELHHASTFVQMLSRPYGPNYSKRYSYESRGLAAPAEKGRVIDASVFEVFAFEISKQTPNEYEVAHSRAIFDTLNQILDTYRPFYNSKGESFPWHFSMGHTLSEYFIDEDSLGLVCSQSRDKMIRIASSLCGLIIEGDGIAAEKLTPLSARRDEKLVLLLNQFAEDQKWTWEWSQGTTVSIMHEMAESIFNDLIAEWYTEA